MSCSDLSFFFGFNNTSWGIDDQHLLSCGTAQQIKDEVRRLMDMPGKPFGNSYIIASTNGMTPEIPIENLQALFEAVHGQ